MSRGRDAASRRTALRRGSDAESLVSAELIRLGWTILNRNWSGGGGELDLVIRRGETLRFVEVKARTRGAATALESISPTKVQRLLGAAEAWLDTHPTMELETCFLLALVDLRSGVIRWLDDPFDG